uniref:MKRN2 opposite strand protein-like N-terminal domain-containing protein n=1 Tax=Gouania willdenowi TaxID=441366 RepID=A0A8C5G1X1_GOUWI
METLHQMMQHPVVCVSHCEQQIFSLKVPENCPLCGLKPPLSNGHTTQCCLLITTTHNNRSCV